MVIWVAVGGRGTLIGAALGAVGVNWARSVLTNYFPELWPFFLGGLFIAVVLLFPDGLVGLFARMKDRWTAGGPWVRKSPASSESNGPV